MRFSHCPLFVRVTKKNRFKVTAKTAEIILNLSFVNGRTVSLNFYTYYNKRLKFTTDV